MRQRQLGGTGESVSSIGLGCMGMVGWYGERDDAEARATIMRALELGVSHLDTAAVYQDGDNERFVGECISGIRDQVFLATKCGLERDANAQLAVSNRPDVIRRSCEASLERLGVDCIDLFYLHRIDPDVPIEESIGAMAELVDAGKIRYVGVSEASPDTIRRAHVAYPIAAVQSELSLWVRADAQPILTTCRDLDIAFVAYSPLGRGFLSGALTRAADLPATDTRHLFPRFQDENFAANLAAVESLAAIAAEIGCTSAQLALSWALHQWEGVLPIPGTKKRRYLEENAAAAEIDLTADQLEAIDARMPETLVSGDRYPESMMRTVNI
jgi:aryl-alcohol dehydrogenase-like predicted oxidoreductase